MIKIIIQFLLSLTLMWPKSFSQNAYIPIQENGLVYEFQYNINDLLTGVVSHRSESRYGDYVKGSYSFLEPNGMIRSVYYEVDGNHGYRSITKFFYPHQVSAFNTIQSFQVPPKQK